MADALSLGLDVGLAKLKLCVGTGETPRWTSVTLPYDARAPYARAHDFASGIPAAVRAFLRAGEAPKRVCAVTSAGYGYPTFHASVVHLAEILEALFPDADTRLLSYDGAAVATGDVRAGDDTLHGPLAFTNPAGALYVARKRGLLEGGRGLVLDTGGSTTGTVIVDGDTVDPAAARERARYTYHRVRHGKLAWYGLQTTPLEALAHEVSVDGVVLPIVPRGVPFENVAALLDLLPAERARKLSFFGLAPPKEDAARAIADAVGLDRSFVSDAAVRAIALELRRRAVDGLAAAIEKAIATAPAGVAARAVCFGLGAEALAKPALEKLGVTDVRLAKDVVGDELAEIASVYGAYLAARDA